MVRVGAPLARGDCFQRCRLGTYDDILRLRALSSAGGRWREEFAEFGAGVVRATGGGGIMARSAIGFQRAADPSARAPTSSCRSNASIFQAALLEILPRAGRGSVGPPCVRLARAGFVLYGGTAIALQLGHGTPVDFDFFAAQGDSDQSVLRDSSSS